MKRDTRPISKSCRIQVFSDDSVLFFSYDTPVAYFSGSRYYKTEKFWSQTTSKHINRWIGDNLAQLMPQEFFDDKFCEGINGNAL